METVFAFRPELYEEELVAILEGLAGKESFERDELASLLRRYPKDGRGFFSKSELIRGVRHFRRKYGWQEIADRLIERIRMKPVRTWSGVAPVTVLTKPFPCPGRCIFCPSDVRMPKSYLSDEPGAQRAAEHRFDPYRQTFSRLRSLHNTGHLVDKVELIVLGGTWSYYPEPYQIWFVKRCFDALNDFDPDAVGGLDGRSAPAPDPRRQGVDFRRLEERLDGRRLGSRTYNRVVTAWVEGQPAAASQERRESAGWEELERAQARNERARARSTGLVVETRPDHISEDEVRRIRRLGATKVQIGIQSLSDEVLEANRRGHDVAATRRAMRLLRGAGFKIHAHWMPNLYGSSPERDIEDFERLFVDPDFRPDELKIYPCSLIESAELMSVYARGAWRPYSHAELLEVLVQCLERTPPYCRLTRIVRDIPGTDIVVGNKLTNFRQIAEEELHRRGGVCRDIRGREVRSREIDVEELSLESVEYETSRGREHFLQYVTRDDRIAAFLRLLLPQRPSFIEEIRSSALVREVHVYGRMVGIGASERGRSQHVGLGRRLVGRATDLAHRAGFSDLAVISAVGTRDYYRKLGFRDGELYQHLDVGARGETGRSAPSVEVGMAPEALNPRCDR